MQRTRLNTFNLLFTKKGILIILVAGILLSYGIYHFIHSNKTPPAGIKVVEVESVQLKDIQQTAAFIGTIKAEQATILVAKSGGILDRYVTSGQHVKKGELIAKVENQELEKNYKLSQEMERLAKIQFNRFEQLYKTGVISKNILEEKKTSWMEYQKKMSDAKIAMDENSIFAPFDGIVGIFKIREGSQVQAGVPLVSIYDPNTTIVEFDVPISIVNSVQDGNPVYINQKQYKLTYIQKMLDEDTHMSPAYVSIKCDNCIIGSTVDVNLIVTKKQGVMVVPFESIFLRNGKNYVYLVQDGKAALTPVELGLREKKEVEITSGLKQNDSIIIRGQARLYPGAAVQIATANQNIAQDG